MENNLYEREERMLQRAIYNRKSRESKPTSSSKARNGENRDHILKNYCNKKLLVKQKREGFRKRK